MKLDDAVVIVTGGGAGIGAALCERFAAEGARHVVVADVDGAAARAIARRMGGEARELDVTDGKAVDGMVKDCLAAHGHIDLFCANAGIITGSGLGMDSGGPFAPLEDFARSWEVNVMGQVHAARAVLPSMLERGRGHILNTASAAGLLTDLGTLAYSITKHASVGLSEWLSIAYGDRGIGVSCLCPMGVHTPMLDAAAARGEAAHLLADVLQPAAVAESVIQGLHEELFLILPHPEVLEYFQRKAADPRRWLRGMRRLREQLYPGS